MKKITSVLLCGIFLLSFQKPAKNIQNSDNNLPPAEKGSFSIVVMADTQGYLGKGTKAQPNSSEEVSNPVFDSQTRWLKENYKNQRIAFLSHAGDVVDMNNRDQWTLARKYMDRLHAVIPYGISVGNHDMQSSGNSSLYQEYFSASRYKDLPWYGGFYEEKGQNPMMSGNNANSFQLFSAEGVKFVVLHLECNAPDKVLKWADQILEMHKDRFAVVTTHMFLGPLNKPKTSDEYYSAPKGVMLWNKCHKELGNTAQQMWDKCFKKHKNLQLIFSGDQSRSNAMYSKKTGDHGNVVHTLLSDYSASPGGALRIYRCYPSQDKIEVISYNTSNEEIVRRTKIVSDEKEHNFSIAVKFKSN